MYYIVYQYRPYRGIGIHFHYIYDLNSGISFFCYVETWSLKPTLLGGTVPGQTRLMTIADTDT